MHVVEAPFDLRKWNSCKTSVVQPYMHDIIRSVLETHGLNAEHDAIYRGGFGRVKDLEHLFATGSDYGSTVIADGTYGGHHAVYASPLDRVAWEPWCRGFDPLYWALKGHRRGDAYNPVSAIVAYRADAMLRVGGDVYAFKNGLPSTDAVAAVIKLQLSHKSAVYVERNVISPVVRWNERRLLARKIRRFLKT